MHTRDASSAAGRGLERVSKALSAGARGATVPRVTCAACDCATARWRRAECRTLLTRDRAALPRRSRELASRAVGTHGTRSRACARRVLASPAVGTRRTSTGCLVLASDTGGAGASVRTGEP